MKKSNFVQKESIVDVITAHILDLIKDDLYKPGDKLPSENDFSEELDASRSSIREALNRLSALNVISSYQGQGYFVNDYNDINFIFDERLLDLYFKGKNLKDVHIVRKTIEPEIISLACKKCNEEDLEYLTSILDKMKEDKKNYNLGNLYERSLDFHLALAIVSHNTIFAKIMELLTKMIKEAYKTIYIQKIDPEEEYNEHLKLFKSLTFSNPDEAKLLMQKHLDETEKIIAK